MQSIKDKKILIIRLTSLGDVIFTLPLLTILKENGAKIGYLTAEKGLGIIKGNPLVDKTHFIPLAKWRKHPLERIKGFFNLIKELKNEKYDIAIDCQQMFKSLLLFAFCGAKRRITFADARELSNLAGNEFVQPKAKFRDFTYHIVERNLDFARYLGLNVDKIGFRLPSAGEKTKTKIDDLLSNFDVKPIVVISPATTWENKHWDKKNWIELVQKLKDKCNLIFTGTSADNLLISEISAGCGLNLCGETDLEELKEIFLRAKLVITTDSGSAHLAWASGNPAVITIFTATPNERFGPYDINSDKYFSVSGNLHCQPCFKKKCRFKTNECSKYPSSKQIVDIVEKILL